MTEVCVEVAPAQGVIIAAIPTAVPSPGKLPLDGKSSASDMAVSPLRARVVLLIPYVNAH